VEKDVLAGLEQGNSILKEIHKETSIEKVEKLMEDTADAIAYQDVIIIYWTSFCYLLFYTFFV